jgi:diguanylate cyclase (GGDEF)-like protein
MLALLDARASILRNIGVMVAVLCILVGSTWAVVKITAEHLLYQDATAAARDWAHYLAENVTDLEQIAGGQSPSIASMAFFHGTGRSGQVFRYEIFNRQGYSQLVSNHGEVSLFDLSEFSADAASSIKARQPVVDAKEGHSADLPSFYAQAYIPVIIDHRPIAIVAAYIDQTEERDNFYRASLIAAISLCLMISLSFLIPAIAWYWRTKEKQQADRRLRFLALHDPLTGLANRIQLIERLEHELDMLPFPGGCLAVHFIDLDHFKEVNDAMGHDGGDFLLESVAERLRAIARRDDIVSRLGGDEFVVVQTGISDKVQAYDFAYRLRSALLTPIKLNEQEMVTTISVGIALAPADGTNPERLLKCADLALYKSKADGRNCIRFFVPAMDAAHQARLALERAIRDAVLHERFILHYQPLFEQSGRRLAGFEALIRLPAEDGTLISPMAFIPVAEEMRLIDQIGAWVLREACLTAIGWPESLTVAVNLSPAQFATGDVSDLVGRTLRETGLAPQRLELEITENLFLGTSETIMAELHKLKALGVSIVMDDFGTGYSSLGYLWQFPFDKIKIDRSFLEGIDTSGQNAETVVKAIIALGRELDMRVTVEGVQTAKQVAFLDGANADQVQGYFFGRPMPASAIGALILRHFQTYHSIQASDNSLALRPPGYEKQWRGR